MLKDAKKWQKRTNFPKIAVIFVSIFAFLRNFAPKSLINK